VGSVRHQADGGHYTPRAYSMAIMTAWLIVLAVALQPSAPDAALAARIPQLFHAVVALDDNDPQVRAAEAEVHEIFTRRGVLTVDEVGDEAAYEFVLLLCSTGPMSARTNALSSVQAALPKRIIPADAGTYCAARIKLDQLIAKARVRPPSNPALGKTIHDMFVRDQAVRQPKDFDPVRMTETDRELEAPLAAILERHGVPTYALAGVEAASEFVTMIQHQPPEFRRKALPRLKANVDAGQADAGSYAMVYDRSQRDEGRNQLYGANLECNETSPELHEAPIDDEAGVNDRRARLGLMRMELYARLVIEMSPRMCGARSK
jgi:hypothetical protein